MNKVLNYILIILIACLVIWAGFWLYENYLKTQPVQSASNDNVSGWAWAENIGLISFNCTDDDSCGDHNYGVNIDNNGKISGYAWVGGGVDVDGNFVPTVGWISFNESDTGPPPSNDPCSDASCIARANPPGQLGKSDVDVLGWARVLVACDSVPCTSVGPCADCGNWDGWIRFDHGEDDEVYIDNNGEFHGWAWGSDVVGWIGFNCLEGPEPCADQGGDICETNENCPGSIIIAGDSDSCCDATCQLMTCSEQTGDICAANENCPGTIISASDSDSCCNLTCTLKTCAQQSGDICAANENCPGSIISASDTSSCCNAICTLKTCAQQGGDICAGGEICTGSFIPASGTDSCCNAVCRLPTCDEEGGEICEGNEECQGGEFISTWDSDNCCVYGNCEEFEY